MPITNEIIKKVADDAGISVDELTLSGFLSFLREKRRKVMLDRLDVLVRYGVASTDDLEKQIKQGEISDHPAWEDLILLENMESAIVAIDEDIDAVQESS